MTRLEQLLNDLCPDGVEYKTIEDIATDIYRGSGIKREDVTEQGVPCVRYGEIYTTYGIWFDQCVSHTTLEKVSSPKWFEYGDILFVITGESVEDIAKSTAYVGHEKCLAGGDIVVLKHNQNPKYLSYALSTADANKQKSAGKVKSKVVHSSVPSIKSITVPVPPLEVQAEIVRVLDEYSVKVELLCKELESELEARKKQYEYYRDSLLNFNHKIGGVIRWVKLEEIADISTGSSNTNEADENGDYPFYVRSQEPLRKNDYEYDETAIITAGDGVGVGKVFHYVDGKYALHQRAYRIHINTNNIIPRYYFHYMRSSFLNYIEKTMFHGSVSSIRRPMLNEYPVPVPPVEIQERIVKVLDNFEAICSDLQIGLPAEIEARKKQYEYYRDLLLSFDSSQFVNVERERERERDGEEVAQINFTDAVKLLQYVYGFAKVQLGSIGRISMCKRIMKSETSSEGEIPFYKIGTFGGKADSYITKETFEKYKVLYPYPKKGDILISAAGTIGRTVIFDGEPSYYQDSNIVWINNDETIVLNSYLHYCYQLKPWNVSTGGTIARLYNDSIAKSVICVPPISEQKRIVDMLDRFDTLCNDITKGLPAEIEARQRQYEYYKEILLSFKMKVEK